MIMHILKLDNIITYTVVAHAHSAGTTLKLIHLHHISRRNASL